MPDKEDDGTELPGQTDGSGWRLALLVIVMALVTVLFFTYPLPDNKRVNFFDYLMFLNKDLIGLGLALFCLVAWLVHKIRS